MLGNFSGRDFFLDIFFNATFAYRFDYWNTRYWIAFSLRMAFFGTSFPQIPLIDFSYIAFSFCFWPTGNYMFIRENTGPMKVLNSQDLLLYL